MREFVYATKADQPSKRVDLATALEVAAKRLAPERQPYSLRINEREMGRWRRRRSALKRLQEVARNGHIGDVYRVRSQDGVVFQLREAARAVRVTDTSGNDKADRCWTAVKDQFPKVSFLGAYVCKEVLGTSTPSQHSYGNAVDFGAGSMGQLYKIASWVLAHRDELDVQNIIVGARIYSPGVGWHAYSGEYHHHVHVDFTPSLSGPCGVRQ